MFYLFFDMGIANLPDIISSCVNALLYVFKPVTSDIFSLYYSFSMKEFEDYSEGTLFPSIIKNMENENIKIMEGTSFK